MLGVILHKLKGTLNYYMYQKTNYPDKAELLELFEDKLLECISTYDESQGTKFITYYSRCLDNVIINLAKSSRAIANLSLEYQYNDESADSSLLAFKFQQEERGYDDVDANVLLNRIKSNLDSSEYNLCKVIINETHNMSLSEMALEMGVTVSGIRGILGRLRKKFSSTNMCEIF
jgi:DNA-directed RNA polymerase specialized sigma subunit